MKQPQASTDDEAGLTEAAVWDSWVRYPSESYSIIMMITVMLIRLMMVVDDDDDDDGDDG